MDQIDLVSPSKIIVNDGGGVTLQFGEHIVYLYEADMRKILKAYPNRLLVNFVRHNCQFEVIEKTIIPSYDSKIKEN